MKPVFLHMLGIPGAGKTTFLEILMHEWNGPSMPHLLGFDQVMQSMPAYQQMEDKIAAFDRFELPARDEGYRILYELMEENRSILFDNGGSAASHIDILKRAANKGYRLVLVAISTPVEMAQRRVDARSISEGRHTPMNYLEDRAQKLDELRTSYRSLTPHYFEIENNGLDFDLFGKACKTLAKDIVLLTERQEEKEK